MVFERIAKFISVGIINTLIDFLIYNVLTSKGVGLSRIKANVISTTIAMLFSFNFNKSLVFESTGGSIPLQAIAFVAVTAFGLYVLQNLVIYFLTHVWLAPVKLANQIVKRIGLRRLFSPDFVAKNSAKVAATVVSLTWNFLLYQNFVFTL